MAEKINIKVPHKLSVEDARGRIDKGFAKVQEQIAGKSVDVEQTWNGEIMNFKAGMMGQSLTGTLTVLEDHVQVEVDLPWFLAKLSGVVGDKLKKGTQLLLDKK